MIFAQHLQHLGCEQLGNRGITALNGPREQHARPPIGRDHGSNHLPAHCPLLLTPPHRQGDRQFIAARLVRPARSATVQASLCTCI
jgi:hypothetical protein